MNNKFPTDIISLAECGGNDFVNKNKNWPVNEKKFFKLAKNLILKHNQECAKLNTQERYVACIDFGFIYYIIHHLNLKILEKILKEKKITALYNGNSLQFLETNFKNLLNPFLKSKENKLKLYIKKNIFNTLYKIIFFNKKKIAIDIGSFDKSKIKYALKKNIRLKKEYPELILKSKKVERASKKYTQFFDKILSSVSNEIKNEFGIVLNLKKIKKISAIRLDVIEQIILRHKNIFDVNYLFASNTYDNRIRIISTIFKLNKKKSIGFDHGLHANGILNKSLLYSNQIFPFTDFVTISKNSSKSLFECFKKNYLYSDLKNINLDNIENKFLKANFDYFRKIPNKKTIKKVMIMGWPMSSRKYFEDGRYTFFYDRIFYEINLIKELKKRNFYVVYKPHPEKKNLINYFYKEYVDEIIFENFENKNILNKVDALIYAHTTSTTFGYALCSNLNIFLLDHEDIYSKNQKKLLEKRVNFVNFDFKSTNKKNYYQLFKNLNQKQKKINYDYVKKFLL